MDSEPRAADRRRRPSGASCTWTWTPSTRRSSNGTIRHCAAARWRSADGPRDAASWPRPATRRAPSACARPCPMSRAVRLCPELVDRPAGLRALQAGLGPGVRALPRGDAAGRADVARRGVSRRDRERLAGAAGHARRPAPQGGDPRAHAAHGVGRRRAQQVPGQDRVRVAEARRPHRDRSGTRRDTSCTGWMWTRCGASGPVTAGKLRACGINKLVDVRTADPERLRGAVGSLTEWLQQLARGIDPRPVVSTHERKSAGSETTFAEDLTDPAAMRAVLVDSGGRRRRLSDAPRALRAHGHDQGALQRLLHHHPQPHQPAHAVGRGSVRAGVCVAGEDRRRDTPGAAPGRERPQSRPAGRAAAEGWLPFRAPFGVSHPRD